MGQSLTADGESEWRTLTMSVGPDSFFESDTIPGRPLKTHLISLYLIISWNKWYEAKRVCCDATAECGR